MTEEASEQTESNTDIVGAPEALIQIDDAVDPSPLVESSPDQVFDAIHPMGEFIGGNEEAMDNPHHGHTSEEEAAALAAIAPPPVDPPADVTTQTPPPEDVPSPVKVWNVNAQKWVDAVTGE